MASFMNRFRTSPAASDERDATRRRRLLRFEPLEDRALMSVTINRMALDSTGDVYTVATLNGAFNFDPAGGSGGALTTSVPTAVLAKYSPTNSLLFVKQFTPAAGGSSAATGVTVSNSTGAIYVSGNFSGTVDLNGGAAPSNSVTSNGGTDGFIVELTSSGNLQPGGARVFGGAANDTATDVVLSADGTTAFVSGDYKGTVNLDPGGTNTTVTSPSATLQDSFLMRLTSDLGFKSAAALGQQNSSSLRLAVDAAGDAYLGGAIGAASGSLFYDAFVAKFDGNGSLVTVRQFGGPSSGGIHAASIGLALDTAGNVYVDGFFTGKGINFDSGFGSGTVALDATGVTDTFVLKLDPNFNLIWARRFGSGSPNNANNPFDLAFSNKGNGSLYVTGVNGPGDATFGTTGAGTSLLSNNTGKVQSYILLLDTSGNAISATATTGDSATTPLNVATNDQGRVIVAGVNPTTNRLIVQSPVVLLSPTPSPTPSGSPSGTPTGTPTGTTPTPTPSATPAPRFLGERRATVKVKKKKVVQYILSFDRALASAGGSFVVTQPGRTKKAAPKHVAVTSMTLGPGGTSVTLTLGKFTAGKPLSLTATGLAGAGGGTVASFVTKL